MNKISRFNPFIQIPKRYKYFNYIQKRYSVAVLIHYWYFCNQPKYKEPKPMHIDNVIILLSFGIFFLLPAIYMFYKREEE